MNLKITEQKENPLLSRTEIKAKLVYDLETPAKAALVKQLAQAMKTDADLMVIKHIYSSYGVREADLIVYLYENKEKLVEMEGEIEQKEEPKAEETAPEAKAEPKAEDKKEEVPPKEEEKKE